MGDRYGEVVKVFKSKHLKDRWGDLRELATVKLDKSGKTVKVIFSDCTEVG